ncbi:serine/threonine-protein kinase [Gloeocapsa sp. PCC 73106]|uniref:serine/threonine-protein kinase n=1 Tax=Gloeocapsa sp. PCC 73106 TaxID=102232 RepID=UPI0002ABF555|nr:pentapeptide repeat-containing protein [Gloeocapsa sp. PCC 73106]ELR97788.1 serine/threonine protein kinase [Gloeocapsa sp. PCC 73106]
MGYCLNPHCSHPQNPPNVKQCQTCGSSLVLGDRYLTVKKLGKGGFGATFLAVDISLPGNPCCVIKQLRPSSSEASLLQMARELFEREARTLGKIGNHPQVPRLLDYFEVDEQFYLIQEFVQGANLQQEIKQEGPFDEDKVRYFLQEILPILDYIHNSRVIHRDIKPANIIRRQLDNRLVLIDFGAVKNEINTLAAADNSSRTALTAFAIGTLGFAPPEQLAMRPVYASDIYAVGVTAIYLLTGKSPKDLGVDSATGELQWQEHVNISSTLTRVLEKMLELSVRQRYKSGREVLESLHISDHSQDLSPGLITQPLSPVDFSPHDDISDSGMLNSGVNKSSPVNRRVSAQAEAIRDLQDRRRQRSLENNLESEQTKAKDELDAQTTLKKHKPANNTSKKLVKLPAQLTSEIILEAYSQGWVDFCQRSLKQLNLKKVDLSGSRFHQSQLVEVNFQGANLSKTDFGRANLYKAILRDANIVEAYLGYANLEEADLRGADLSFAYMNYANLKGANLCGANLTNARISDVQMAQAKTNWKTVFPSGRRNLL